MKCRIWAALGMTGVLATTAVAQTGRCMDCAARADSTFVAGDARGSLDIVLEGLKRDSNDVEMLWRAARSEMALGILSAEERKVIDAYHARAAAYARRAVALAPNSADPHFWLAAACGRRALRSGFRAGVGFASEAYAEASRALAIDSTHAGAHEIIGKLHSEVRKLPWVVRQLVAAMSSLDVARHASWETSEHHLRKALALDSTFTLAWVDLSQLYLRTGRRAEAIAVVEEFEKRPRRSPVDYHLQVEARRRLDWYP